MYKLNVPLAAYLMGNQLFLVKERKMVKMDAPVTWTYEPLADADNEYFFTSKSQWIPAIKQPCSYEEWRENVKYPFSYLTHIFLTQPDLVRGNAHNDDLKLMYFDIETMSDGSGRFPRAEQDPLIMFGYAIDDGEIKVHYVEDLGNRPAGIEDRELLRKFLEVVETENPDILVTYNGYSFDMPYILTRCRKLGLNTDPLLRMNGDKEADRLMMAEAQLPTGPLISNMGTRLHYDIFKVDVLRDQSLSGIKDRRMKTVGKWFLTDIADNIIDLEDGISNTRAMMLSEDGIRTMIDYQKSDIMVTRGLSKVYFDMSVSAANSLGLPLNMILNRSSGTLASAQIIRTLLEHRIIPDLPNETIFEDMYALIERNKKADKEIKKSFQGAYVDMYKRGSFKKLYKLDFNSLYPSIIILFNLSYETVRFDKDKMVHLAGDRSTNWNKFQYDRRPYELDLFIPDANFKRVLPVTIDMGYHGILPKLLSEGLAKRKEIRNKMKDMDHNDPEYISMNSAQQIVKVLNNSVFGILSNRYSVGYLPIGFTITGLGRILIRKAIEIISDPKMKAAEYARRTRGELWSEEWRKTCPIVEIDTDGLLIEGDANADIVNAELTRIIKKEFGIDNKVLKMAKEEFGSGYIHGMKNYLLLEPGNPKPIIHGSFFKSSRAAAVTDATVNLLIDNLLHNRLSDDETIRKATDLSWAKPEDYKIKVKMSKNIRDYKSNAGLMRISMDEKSYDIEETSSALPSGMIAKIAESYKDAYGFTPMKGDMLEFVMAKDQLTGKSIPIPYNKIMTTRRYVIDTAYYLDTINTLLEPILARTREKTTIMNIWENI